MTVISTHLNVNNSNAKTHALVAYILIAIGLFTAIPILFGAVWAMIKKQHALGTVYHSHYVNATRMFWWALFWTIIGVITYPILIGYLIIGILWLWLCYRVLMGFANILSDQPYPL